MPAVHDDDAVTTEAEALADIVDWSANRPLWQRDGLRRLTEAEKLTAQDIDELTALCKDQSLPATPLSASHVRAPDAGMPPDKIEDEITALRDWIANLKARQDRVNAA